MNIRQSTIDKIIGEVEARGYVFVDLIQSKQRNPQVVFSVDGVEVSQRIDSFRAGMKNYTQQNNLPRTSGLYRFVDKMGKIVYIGKTTNIGSRFISHRAKGSIDVDAYEFEYCEMVIANAHVLEPILVINHKPKLNSDFIKGCHEYNLNFKLPDLVWIRK